MGSADHVYSFKSGTLYNLEASNVIRNGGGLSGAHSDIVHPEVAHVLWEAMRATPDAFEVDLSHPQIQSRETAQPAAPGTAAPRRKTFRGGLLGLSPTERAASDGYPGPAAPSAPDVVGQPTGVARADDTPPRWINAELDGRRADEPLVVSLWYTLKLAVDIAAKTQPGGVSTLLADLNFAVDQDSVGLAVQVDSVDFETAPTTRT